MLNGVLLGSMLLCWAGDAVLRSVALRGAEGPASVEGTQLLALASVLGSE